MQWIGCHLHVCILAINFVHTNFSFGFHENLEIIWSSHAPFLKYWSFSVVYNEKNNYKAPKFQSNAELKFLSWCKTMRHHDTTTLIGTVMVLNWKCTEYKHLLGVQSSSKACKKTCCQLVVNKGLIVVSSKIINVASKTLLR